MIKKAGEINRRIVRFPEEHHSLPPPLPPTTAQGTLGLVHDITEEKRIRESEQWSREHLEKALEANKSLLRELNHRVKNNLAIISSLINLQIDTPDSNRNLEDLKLQIEALRLLYNRLNTAEESEIIDLKSYLDDLLKQIFITFCREDIRVDKEIGIPRLDSKLAGQIGLIINEVATNAVKHAYRGIEQPVFEINISEDTAAREAVLRLANNGHPTRYLQSGSP